MKNKKFAILFILVFVALVAVSGVLVNKFQASCPVIDTASGNTAEQTTKEEKTTKHKIDFDYDTLALELTMLPDRKVDSELLKCLNDETLTALQEASQQGSLTDSDWVRITGYSLKGLKDKYQLKTAIDMGNNGKDSFVLGFTGDINFTPTGYVMTHAANMPNSVMDCIDETYQEEMKAADIMLVNNEFPYSDRGTPTQGKKYTFCADPDTVKYMTELGVDIVSLANNHAYDYGYDAFVDTLQTLKDANIPYVGAGMNIEEASKPVTFLINGYKVGYLASSGVEYPIWTPVATEDSEGIMGCYDDGAAMIEAIKKAKEECDYVIVYPHWGYENTTSLSNAQTTLGKAFIDAGADAVVGNHSHCLQGIEFYKGVPIIYSLGNFWFNTRNVFTAMLKLTVSEEGIETSYVPGRQANSETHYLSDPEDRRYLYNQLISWSPNNAISIDDNGVITEK